MNIIHILVAHRGILKSIQYIIVLNIQCLSNPGRDILTRCVFLIFIILLAFLQSEPANANHGLEIVEVSNKTKKIKINSKIHYFFDKDRRYESPNKELLSKLALHSKGMLFEPHSVGYFWMGFQIKNTEETSLKKVLLIDAVQTGLISLYKMDQLGNIIATELSGTAIRPTDRSIQSHLTALQVNLLPKEQAIFLIKRKANYLFTGNIFLECEKSFKETELRDIILISIYFGSVLALILYNLFVFFYTKNRVYLSYVYFTFSLSSLMLVVFGGYDLYFFDKIGVSLTSHVTFFTALTLITAFRFCRRLFGQDYLPPYCKYLFTPFLIFHLLCMFLNISPWWEGSVIVFVNYLYDAALAVTLLIIFHASLFAYRKGHPLAKLYLISWSFIICSAIIWFSRYVGLDASKGSPKFYILLGSFLEMITIAFSFTYKINYLDKMEHEQKYLTAEKEKYRTLLNMIIHDLSNNISNMYNYAEALYKKSDKSKDCETYHAAIDTSYENIVGIIDSARPQYAVKKESEEESGPLLADLDIARLNVRELLTLSIQTLKTQADSKKLTVTLEVDASAEWIKAERISILNNIFNNILSNAIKFSYENGTINIKAQEISMNRVAISFQDFGVGIDESKVRNILNFEIVSSEPGTLGEEGSGNGLRIAQSFLQLQNGFLEIESSTEPGQSGTIFTVSLPAG